MDVWRLFPGWQEEMLSYLELLQIGVQPIVQLYDADEEKAFRVSNSALNTIGCSVKALLRYGFKVLSRESVFHMQVGTAVHKGIACYFKTGDANKAYQKFLEAFPEGQAPEDRLALDNVGVIVHHYLHETLKHFPYYVHKSLIEIWFEQIMGWDSVESGGDGGPIVLVGRIDLMPEDPVSKAMMVLDWKTTGRMSDWWLKKWRMDSGLNGYAWAAREFMPGSVFPGNVIGVVELPKLSMPGKKCKKHGVDYGECRKFHPQHQVFSVSSEPHMIEEWRRSALWGAKRLKALIRDYGPRNGKEGVKYVRMLGKFNGMCVFCEYQDFCLADRPVEWIGTVLQYKGDVVEVEG
jgi:hypothetical protein